MLFTIFNQKITAHCFVRISSDREREEFNAPGDEQQETVMNWKEVTSSSMLSDFCPASCAQVVRYDARVIQVYQGAANFKTPFRSCRSNLPCQNKASNRASVQSRQPHRQNLSTLQILSLCRCPICSQNTSKVEYRTPAKGTSLGLCLRSVKITQPCAWSSSKGELWPTCGC